MKNILLKYNLIKIVAFEDTFFHTSVFPKKVKFSKELLRLNFGKYSPFLNPHILSYFADKRAMVWFYKKNIKAPFVIPESFFLANELKKQKQDAIYVINDDIIKILVIKDDKLLDAFTIDRLDKQGLQLIINKHQISDITHIEKNQYEYLYKTALKNLSLKDIYEFRQYDFNIKTISKDLLNQLSYPLSALIVFAILLNFAHGILLDKKIKALKTQYLNEKSKNQTVKNEIRTHNIKIRKWKNFIQTELIYPMPLMLLNDIYKIFKPSDKATIKDISIENGKMTLRLQTNTNPVIFLNRLSKIKYLQNVIIASSFKRKGKVTIVTYEIDIKPYGAKNAI